MKNKSKKRKYEKITKIYKYPTICLKEYHNLNLIWKQHLNLFNYPKNHQHAFVNSFRSHRLPFWSHTCSSSSSQFWSSCQKILFWSSSLESGTLCHQRINFSSPEFWFWLWQWLRKLLTNISDSRFSITIFHVFNMSFFPFQK